LCCELLRRCAFAAQTVSDRHLDDVFAIVGACGVNLSPRGDGGAHGELARRAGGARRVVRLGSEPDEGPLPVVEYTLDAGICGELTNVVDCVAEYQPGVVARSG